MIRASVISVVDQALLSALNLGLSVLLIRFSTKADYGLYSQLINLQSLLSPFHAGIFVSAYLAIASKMDASRQARFQSSMAQAELIVTGSSAMLIAAACLIGAKRLHADISSNLSLSFAGALLVLWWREFARQTRFVNFEYRQALNIDALYCLATTIAVLTVLLSYGISTVAVLWCMTLGGVIAVVRPLTQCIQGAKFDGPAIRRDVAVAWNIGRWEVIGSIVTWGYAQSYVYFAALHGGLDAAAEISAGRLLGTPLALLWASYGNVLRPKTSRLLVAGSYERARSLGVKSAVFVICLSTIYGAVMFFAIPLLERSLFGGKFPMLRMISMWWIAYFTLTGVSTVAVGMMRSALEFKGVFGRQVINCIVAIVLLGLSLRFQAVEALVVAMVLVEAMSAFLFWRSAMRAISHYRIPAVGQASTSWV